VKGIGIRRYALGLCLLVASGACAADWPQLQCNPQRTGYTADTVKPPLKFAWARNFHPERVSRDVQPVVYAGKVYVGTKSGNLYGLDAGTGQQAWVYKAGGPILHTAACADGKVAFGCLDGRVYAVNADTGELAWRFDGAEGYGFSTAPLIAEGTVFIGQRQGIFYALRLADGHQVWAWDSQAPLFNSAAYDQGKVFFANEAIRVFCLNARTGRVMWQSEQLYGQSTKQYCPIIYQGLVLIRPMMAHPPGMWEMPPFWPTWDRDEFAALCRRHADVLAGKMPDELLAAQDKVVEFFRQRPYDQDLFVLNESTGKQAFIPPHFRIQSLTGPVCPPVADGRGTVIIPWAFINHGWARLDLKKQRIVEMIVPPRPTNADETLNVSVGGNLLFIMHCEEGNANYTGIYDLDGRKFIELPGVPNRWGELADNDESGGQAASISNGCFYHIVFHQLAAWTSAAGEEVQP